MKLRDFQPKTRPPGSRRPARTPEQAEAQYHREEIERRERTRCTVCGRRVNWYELEPGTGRCTECMP